MASRDNIFSRFASAATKWTGSTPAFIIATATVLIWCVSGPIFHFSETWQLTINTGTTIVTFLMVFLIQASQNRESEAIQIKLDEIIRALDAANNELLDLEEMEEEDLVKLHRNYLDLAERAHRALRK